MHGSPPPGGPSYDPNETELPTRDDAVPRLIVDGRYRVERVIGEGAFGRVYLAFDTRLRNNVAIKELLATRHMTDPTVYARYVERFEREARAVFALHHPNVVTVYEMHQDSAGNQYLVMEYIDGLSLRDLLIQVGVLPTERAIAIATDLARALEAIDERGIVHRDFKPANIMMSKRGTAKLADFGVALIPSETQTRPIGVAHPGAPAYMSPEQATGSGPVDGRSDLYSLGLVLYEMLVGRRYGDVGQPLPVMRPDLPPQLVSIVERLLQPRAEWRYPSARELVRDLESLTMIPALPPPLPPPQPPPRPPQPLRRWRGPVFGVTGVAVVVLAAFLATQVWPRPTPTATPIPTAIAAPTATAPLSTPTAVATATPAPATATSAPTATATPLPSSTPTRPTATPTSAAAAAVPLGSRPLGWKTYTGPPRAPFALYYPPNWTVDESGLAKDGSVEFKDPSGAPFLSIFVSLTRTTTSIDTLRDGQAKVLAQSCLHSGVEVTEQVTLSGGVIFDDLVESCDLGQPGQLSVWLVGSGLNNGYPWYFDGASDRKDYSKTTCSCPGGNLETFFAPMLYSLHIYANPVG